MTARVAPPDAVETGAPDPEPDAERVPWLVPVAGFVAGFLAAVVPASFVTHVLRSQLPLAGSAVHGRTAFVVALVLSVCVGVAGAVCSAARAARG